MSLLLQPTLLITHCCMVLRSLAEHSWTSTDTLGFLTTTEAAAPAQQFHPHRNCYTTNNKLHLINLLLFLILIHYFLLRKSLEFGCYACTSNKRTKDVAVLLLLFIIQNITFLFCYSNFIILNYHYGLPLCLYVYFYSFCCFWVLTNKCTHY